jgi:bacterioferritin (cytochrome b1)
MTKEEALKQFAQAGAVWFGNSKQHFAFSAYCRLQGWNKLADKWKGEAEEEWDEAEEVLNRLVEMGCKPADLQEAMKTQEFPFYDAPKQQIETDFEDSKDAIKVMSEMAAAFSDDYPTQKLIYKWIDGEKEHIAWMCQYLNYIEKLGYENFLTAMM